MASGSVIADLLVNLIGNNTQLVAATAGASKALEDAAATSVRMSATIRGSLDESGFSAEKMAIKVEEATARESAAVDRSLQQQLASVRALAAQRDAAMQTSFQAQLALWHEEADAYQALTAQKVRLSQQAARAAAVAAQEQYAATFGVIHEEMASYQSLNAQRVAAEAQVAREIAAQDRVAAQERVVIEREAQRAMALERERTAIAYRQNLADQAVIAREEIALRRQVAAADKAAAAEQIAARKTVNGANAEAMGILRSLTTSIFGVSEESMKATGAFSKLGGAVVGAGTMGEAVMGPLGIAVAAAGSIGLTAFDAVKNVLSAAWDMTVRLTEGVALFGTVAVISAAHFDQLMLRTVTMAQASIDNLDQMKQAVLGLAPTVGIGPDELAKGLYHVESLGYSGATAMEILKRASQEAAMSGANLESVTTALGAIFRTQFKDVTSAADAASYLNTITGIGNLTMQDLTSSIGTGILPVLKTAGLGMRDFGAAIALAGDNAEPANQAANKLRQTIAMIETAALSPKKVKMFELIGMEADQMAKDLLKPDGLKVAVLDLKDHLIKAFGPEAVKQLQTYAQIMEADGKQAADDWAASTSKAAQVVDQVFGGARSGGFINMLLSQSDQLVTTYGRLGDEGERGARFAKAWKEQQKELNQYWKDFKAWVESVTISIGEKLIPKVKEFFGYVKTVFTELKMSLGDTHILKDFEKAMKKLSDDVIPEVKKAISGLIKVVDDNRGGLEKFGKFVDTVILPLFGKAFVEVFKDVINIIMTLIEIVAWMGNEWDKHKVFMGTILKAFVLMFDAWAVGLLTAIAAAFGWIPGIGDRLDQARKDIDKFSRETINDITRITQTPLVVDVRYNDPGYVDATGSVHRGHGMVAQYAAGGLAGPGPIIVGENGPELLYLSGNGYVVPNDEAFSSAGLASFLGGSSGGSSGGGSVSSASRGGDTVVQVFVDGDELRNATVRTLNRRKFRNGSTGVN